MDDRTRATNEPPCGDCWCDEVDDRSCICGHLPHNLGWHALNCPQHRWHRECYDTRSERQVVPATEPNDG